MRVRDSKENDAVLQIFQLQKDEVARKRHEKDAEKVRKERRERIADIQFIPESQIEREEFALDPKEFACQRKQLAPWRPAIPAWKRRATKRYLAFHAASVTNARKEEEE